MKHKDKCQELINNIISINNKIHKFYNQEKKDLWNKTFIPNKNK